MRKLVLLVRSTARPSPADGSFPSLARFRFRPELEQQMKDDAAAFAALMD